MCLVHLKYARNGAIFFNPGRRPTTWWPPDVEAISASISLTVLEALKHPIHSGMYRTSEYQSFQAPNVPPVSLGLGSPARANDNLCEVRQRAK